MFLRAFASLALFVCASLTSQMLAAKPITPDAVLVAADGGEKIAIAFDDRHVYVDVGDKHLIGTSSAGKSVFTRASGEAVAEIKAEGKGFNVFGPDAKLLWKVKITDDKITVVDNEQMRHSWSIKFKKGENAKVLDANEKEVGAVKLKSDSGKIKIKNSADKDVYVVESGRGSAGYGVLLMKNVPQELRYAILGELFVLGR